MKDVPKAQLIGEHLRRSRQTRRAVTSALSTLTILLVAAVVAGILAVGQAPPPSHQATVSEAGQLAAISQTLTGSHLDLAELFAAEAYHMYQDPQTRAALFGAVTADPHLVRYLPATGTSRRWRPPPTGSTAVAGTAGGDVLRWNLTDFQRSVVAKLPAAISSVAVSANGNTIAAVDGSAALVWDPRGGRPAGTRSGTAGQRSPPACRRPGSTPSFLSATPQSMLPCSTLRLRPGCC